MIKNLLTSITFLFSITTHAHEFNWDNLMLAHSQLNPAFDYEVAVDTYMKLYRFPVWQKYKNDEFELEEKRQQTIELMQQRIESFDLNEEFTLRTSVEFEQYDFKTEEFPLTQLSGNSYFYNSNNRVDSYAFARVYQVYFKNTDIFGNLEMQKEDAKNFVQSKKTPTGRIKRALPMEIKFVIVERNGNDDLNAVITEINVFDADNTTLLTTFR